MMKEGRGYRGSLYTERQMSNKNGNKLRYKAHLSMKMNEVFKYRGDRSKLYVTCEALHHELEGLALSVLICTSHVWRVGNADEAINLSNQVLV